MAHSAIRIISGNFVTAKPIGIVNGIDFQLTGTSRKIASDTIHHIFNAGSLVLLSPLGFSPTGESFNLTMEDVSVAAATALRADKLIFISETPMMVNQNEDELRELSPAQADMELKANYLPPDSAFYVEQLHVVADERTAGSAGGAVRLRSRPRRRGAGAPSARLSRLYDDRQLQRLQQTCAHRRH